jgi:hypothetical protein
MPWVEDEQNGSHYERPRQRLRGQIAIDGLESIQEPLKEKPPRSEKQLANDERLRDMAKKRRETP